VTIRAGAEYLLWWTKGDPVPPLATTSPAGTAQGTAGILGQDGTSVLFGGSGVDSGLQQGARFTIAIGNTDGCPCGLEADFFFLGGHVTHFQANSDGSTILARPFFDPTANANSAQLVAFPGSQSGSVSASTLSQLLGAGVRIRERLLSGGPVTLDFLGGYRYLHLADRLNVNDNSTVTNPNGLTDANGNFNPNGTVTSRFDRFEATNDFHGADLGFVTAFNQGPLSVEVLTKVAFGVTHRFVDISGSTTTTQPGSAPVTSAGGLLALPSNSMTLGTSTFAVVPEFGLKLGYQVRDNIRLTAGYTYFYWSHVSRAGDQVDFTVNTTQQLNGTLTGANRPQFVIHDTTFWAQGISLGVEFVY
jgi:hypothetical protein